MEEDKNWFMKLLDNWKAISAAILIIVTTALAIRTAFWEYDDKAREREQKLKEQNRTEDNLQQAYFINQIIKKQFDSLRVELRNSNAFFYSNSVKKDSMMLLVVPRMNKELGRQGRELKKINQKINMVLEKQPQSDRVDFIKLLHDRDMAADEKARKDSMDMVLLREIRNINKILLYDNIPQPKYGDRAK